MKLVSIRQRAAWLALLLTLTLGSALPTLAQQRNPVSGAPGGQGAVPLRAHPMTGDGTHLPPDVMVRSLQGVKGFEQAAKSRVRIGGENGASVIEKVVNVTQTPMPPSTTPVVDEITPFWSPDERFLYYAYRNPTTNLYGLAYIAAEEPADGANQDSQRRPITNPAETQFDYKFPVINNNGNRIAFIRSTETAKGPDDDTKVWHLYVSDLPAPGGGTAQYIDTAPLGPTNLRSLTAGRTFPNGTVSGGQPERVAFVTVGRPAWIGANDIAFAARLQGDPNFNIFTVNIQSGVLFQLTGGNADERNPAVSPDGRFIAFDSNAQAMTTGNAYLSTDDSSSDNIRVRSETDPQAIPSNAQQVGPNTQRNIFTMQVLGQRVRQFTLRYANAPAANNVEPAWSSAERNNFTNANGDLYYIAFSSSRIPQFDSADTSQTTVTGWAAGNNARRSIYYAIFSRQRGNEPVPLQEVDPTNLDNFGSDGARRLDTGNDTLVQGRLNDVTQPRFNDRYPTWAPIIRSFRIGFQSNRNGTYSTNGFGTGFTASPTHNLFFASLIDITAPTLVRYDTSTPTGEIVHINLVTNPLVPFKPEIASSVRSRDNGITPGAMLHFAVRVEDREAGLHPTQAVYLQFKNPNSSYQSRAQGGNGGEHKEFTSARFLSVEGNPPVAPFYSNFVPTGISYGLGYEYECHAISAANRTTYFGHNNTFVQNRPPALVPGTPTTWPLYTPSINDAAAFSGDNMPPLDGTGGRPNVWLKLEPLFERNPDGTIRRDSNNNPIPVRPADGSGGVLYGAVWQAPDEASDWYIDVIVYDNAVNPFNPTDVSNVIIYDNVWGFSTAAPISGPQADVLVVMDYALGQKFFGARFGAAPAGTISTGNQLPIFYGAESYYTDIHMGMYPHNQPGAQAPPAPMGTDARQWAPGGVSNPFAVNPQLSNGAFGGVAGSGVPNVLGVESYNDEYLLSGSVVSDTIGGVQFRTPPTGRYSIWRILSRGPVPASVLRDYLPQITTMPRDTFLGEQNDRTIQHSTRYVVWASPFSGNLFVGSGTITDVQTQIDLENYITAGGRLFISGQDIGWSLVGQGQSNRFFEQILKARYISDGAPGSTTGLNAADTTIAGNYIGQIRQDPWNPAGSAAVAFGRFNGTTPNPYVPLNATVQVNADLPYQNNYAAGPIGDASPTASATGGLPDTIQAAPSTTPAGLPATTPPDSTDEFLYNTTPGQPTLAGPGVAPTAGNHTSAIIASSYPVGTSAVGLQTYDPNRPFVPQGKVVYASCGFESIGNGWYTYSLNNQTFFATFGRRAELMFAIGSNMRTGTITGKVIDNNGSPVPNALVRVIPNTANANAVAAGIAITDDNGSFQVVGLQPGFYVVFAFQAGFFTQHNLGNTVHGGWRADAQVTLKKAGPASLTGDRNTTNNSQGGVFSEDGTTPIGNVEIQVRRRETNGRWTMVATMSSNGRDPVTLPDGSQQALPAGAYLFPTLLVTEPQFGYKVLANATTIIDENGVEREKTFRTFTDPATGQTYRARANFNGTPRLEQYGEVIVGETAPTTYRLGNAQTTVVTPPNTDIGPVVPFQENTVHEIDFLLPARPQRITGQVVDQDTNEPIEGAVVTATAQGTNTVVATGTTDASGNYTLALVNPPAGTTDPTLLPGGTYVLVANANGYSTASPPSQANGVTATVGSTLADVITAPQIRLKILPPGSISGLVRRFNGANFTTSGVDGAVVTLYAVTIVNGQQIQAENPSYTITVSATPTTTNGYTFNYQRDGVLPGTYNAYVSKPGLTGNPSPFAGVTVTTGTETRNVNFTLEPPKIYGQGIQLISVPQDFSNIPTRDVFGVTQNGDNNGDGRVDQFDQQIFSTFNIADWTGTEYQISPAIPLRVGKGYFARFGAITAVNAQGNPVNTPTFTIDLSASWNLIGHPFANQMNISDPAADIDISSPEQATYSYTVPNGQSRINVPLATAVADGAVQSTMYSYTGSLSGGAYVQGSILKPWFGYWFRAFVPVQMTLRYPGAGTRALKQGAKFVTVTRAQRDTITPREIKSNALNDWRIQIAAQQGDLRDTDNAIGVSPEASAGFDNRFDAEKPPMMREVPALYVAIQGTDKTGRSASFADNIKAAGGRTQNWDFTVETTGGNGEVTLYWPNIGRLPRGIDPVLVDVATGKRVAMRSSSAFRFAPSGRAQRQFRVEVAPPTSLPLDILNLQAVPGRSLAGSTYRFSFLTTRAADVDAEVKTLTGRTLKRIRTRAVFGTTASVNWDGRDERGALVPPGPYVVSITAQDDQGRKVTRNATFQAIQ